MTNPKLHVWRDLYTHFEHVGILQREDDEWEFGYDADYAGKPISLRMPIRTGRYSAQDTSLFFSALAPEGRARTSFLRQLRAESDEYEPLLQRLNDETQGALVFSTDCEKPGRNAAYAPLETGFFETFAAEPQAVAFETMGRTRLSLAGAMAKVGLYRSPDGTWFLPMGSAPSNCIVKAGDRRFAHEVINEALCLETARRCDFDVPRIELIPTANGPLLAEERFDRPTPLSPRFIDGLPVPVRLHQEDFCQICGLPSSWKYEPTDGGYFALCTSAITRFCANAFGERQLFASYVLFDYLMGNCDNHLKNYSLLYDEGWKKVQLSPRYDIVCTTVYPNLYTEMGVSLQSSRSVFGLDRRAVQEAFTSAKLPSKMTFDEYDEMAAAIPPALADAADHLVEQGFHEARHVADVLADGVEKRATFAFDPEDALALT